jgi:hypothetical protein
MRMVEIGKYMVNLTSIFEREKTQYYKALADAEIKMWKNCQPVRPRLRSVQLIAGCPMFPSYLCFHMFVV